MAGFRKNIAIVIGINTYQQGISTLKTAVNDAEELAKILQEQHGYTTLLFLDQVATRSTLLELLTEKLPRLVTTDDRLLFYFAGHGIALNGEDGPEGYLIPQDARLGDVSTYLAMSQVHKALLQLPCRHFLGIQTAVLLGLFVGREPVSWSPSNWVQSTKNALIASFKIQPGKFSPPLPTTRPHSMPLT